MDQMEWAKNEVDLAISSEGGSEYINMCYKAALEAFNVLCNQGHSGMSIQITQEILNRLIDGKPLTPIKDVDENWTKVERMEGEGQPRTLYQCNRMSTLFKTVYDDGKVSFSCVDRDRCVDADNPTTTWYSGFVSNIIKHRFPIKMPYTGDEKYLVYCKEYLTDQANGDFDTIHLIKIVDQSGNETICNQYFKDSEYSFVEIDEKEFLERKKKAEELKKKMMEENLDE